MARVGRVSVLQQAQLVFNDTSDSCALVRARQGDFEIVKAVCGGKAEVFNFPHRDVETRFDVMNCNIDNDICMKMSGLLHPIFLNQSLRLDIVENSLKLRRHSELSPL